MKKAISKYDRYSITVMILAALQIIGFFTLPYALADKQMMGGFSGIASAYSGVPEYVSAFNILRTLNGSPLEDMFKGCMILLVAPILCCVQLIIHSIGKRKAGHILTIILSILQVGDYAIGILIGQLVAAGFSGFYKVGAAGWIQITLAVSALIVSIVALASGSKRKAKTVPVVAAGKKRDGLLIGVSGAYAGARIPVHDGETLVIGRDPRVCNIVLGSLSTSRKHCAITYDEYNNTYTVTDYSSNGVFDKNGNRLEKGWKDLMRIGDEIRIANTVEVFRFGF